MWDLIVSVPDHCLSFYFSSTSLSYFCSYCITFTLSPLHDSPTFLFFLSIHPLSVYIIPGLQDERIKGSNYVKLL